MVPCGTVGRGPESAEEKPAEEENAKDGEEGAKDGEGEGEDKKEEEKKEGPPPLEREPYMTREYYMPGYVDKTPPKEYPPQMMGFMNYLKSIREIEKPNKNNEFAPDTSGFAPDTEGFAPDTDGFAPDTTGFAPDTSDYAPKDINYGNQQWRPEMEEFDY